jgi:hypothetical protein
MSETAQPGTRGAVVASRDLEPRRSAQERMFLLILMLAEAAWMSVLAYLIVGVAS